jgi:ubiquitin C-terminal hydrolase
MDDSEKEILENLKNFDTKKLIVKDTYVEIQTNEGFKQSYICDVKGDKYEVVLPNIKGFPELPINMLNFYSENDYPEEGKMRPYLINEELGSKNINSILNYINIKLKSFNIKLSSVLGNNSKKGNNSNAANQINKIHSNTENKMPDKNGKMIDITGYKIYQFFCGYILDCLFLVHYELVHGHLDEGTSNLFACILDIARYMGEVVKTNLKSYKTAYYNRKLLIVSPIHAILIAFDSLICNLIQKYQYGLESFPDINKKLSDVVNIVYDIVVASKELSAIPFPCLSIFLKFIVYKNVRKRIIVYDKKLLYHSYNEHLKNLNENELKCYKRNSDMKDLCEYLVDNLFNKHMNTLINESYFIFLISCLKCKNLEKKMNALNDITEIISDLPPSNKIDYNFKQLIEKNKILDFFFEESIHDEIIKRSFGLFKYYAKFDYLSDDIISKIIERQTKNELMKKLLVEIISELPKQKKDILYKKLTEGVKPDNINNIEYISKLTESCFNKSKNDEKTPPDNNYYGLNMIFDSIIKDFNDKKKYDENIIDTSIDSFERTINKITHFDDFEIGDIFFFIDKLFDNIKNNGKHNSIIQSIKLIQKLLNIIRNKRDNHNLIKYLKNSDEKYDIITLLVNDLVRYMELLPSDYTNEKCKDQIYEGIYPHYINIEQRLKLIFYFFKKNVNNYGLNVKGKKHIEKLYQIFKSEKYKEEKKKFYELFTRNINEIDDIILEEFFKDIIENKNEFDLKTINDNESINLIIQTFKKVNENKSALFYDGKNIRIEGGSEIEGFDLLFDLLTQNPNKNVQNRISNLLCDVCLSLKDYNNEKIPEYWKMYFNKINLYLDNIRKSHDKVAFSGIIKLLNTIYSWLSNCQGKIPGKEDYKSTQEPYKIYHFSRVGTKKEYKLKAGNNDKIFDLRWKIGYYFDIPVNNVVFIDLSGKVYSLNNDFDIFVKVFSNEKYFNDRNFAYVKIDEKPFQLLEMKDNPKSLIEENENIYNILIDNLKVDLKNDNDFENENKQKVWKIISKLPKNYYFINKLKKYGDKEPINESDLFEIFDHKELYLLTYSLQCFYYFLFDKKNGKDKKVNQIIHDKKEFINNFIEVHHGDKLILDKLLNININKDNCRPIQIECLTIIIDMLNEIENYKENEKSKKFENIFESKERYKDTLIKISDNIANLLELNYTKYKNYFNQINDDSNDYTHNSNENKKTIYENIANLIEHICNFTDEISFEKMSYMEFLFINKDLFTEIFVYDYIKSESEESRKKIDEFLTKNYNKNNYYIQKYLEITLSIDIFNYLLVNDEGGTYFHVISFVMQNFYNNDSNNNIVEKENKKINLDYTKQSKQIINIILEYIETECEKKEEKKEIIDEKEEKLLMKKKENFKEGILLFLASILTLNPKELVNYIISKVDICDLFLNKCIMRKCNQQPLQSKNPFCRTSESQNAVYNLLIVFLKNLQNNDLYMKILGILDRYHLEGFWKTYNVKNWDLESKEMQKIKYVGLKNMTATCYLNSIIQQLYMIPMFRETILKINNTSKTNVLYELQLLFSALKIYELGYYDPRSFVVINNLNFYEQMDADEFYGILIDRIENDIKQLYSKTPTPGSTSTPTPTQNDSKNENYKYKDIFNYFFGIKVLDELKFVDCGHKRYNEFFYNNIQLEIKEFNNIHDSLKNYFRTEVMDGDNKINCEVCKIKRTCHKHLIFKSLPNILVIALKRFEFDYNTMLKYKLNKYFEFPFELDMKDYLIENHKETNTEYELTGITIHFGVSDFGHYYDLIKGPDNKWYKFNDISVSEFKEEDIPREAYGEKEIFDEDSYKEKENGKNNAYILIYTKKGFGSDVKEKKIKTDLALPPYNKFSNISDDIKNEINFKLYKSWTLKNILHTVYQNFVVQLLELDLCKIIDENVEKNHKDLVNFMRGDGFPPIESKGITPEVNNNEIFEFCLRYYFNVILRVSRKQEKSGRYNYFIIFKEMIRIYTETDVKRAKYLLEEFSNTEAINEYLIYCPNQDSVRDCYELILNSYNVVFKKTSNTNDSFIYEFMNTLIVYIDINIRQINLSSVIAIFEEIFKKGGNKFLIYLNKKSFAKWVQSFYGNRNNQDYYKNIVNENMYPIIHSQHSIIIDKKYKSSKDKKGLNEESDAYDQHFYNNKLKDNSGNVKLIEFLGHYFDD